ISRRESLALLAAPLLAQPKISVLHRSTVFSFPITDPYDAANRYGFSHAPNICTLPDGRLLAVWFCGPFEGAVNQVILGAYSADDGQTWSRGEVMQDFPRQSDFDPSLLVSGTRTHLFLIACRWNRYPFVHGEKNFVGKESYRIFHRVSDDSGRTWSEPTTVQPEPAFCTRGNGIRHSSGTLLVPIYQMSGDHACVLKSTDDGRTWKRAGRVTCPMGTEEPVIAELRSGAVMMILRTRDGYLWRAISTDRGETWAASTKTDIVAARASHSILRTRDGRLVLTHDECPPPNRTPLTVRVSNDDGESWSAPFTLTDVPVPKPGDKVWGRQVTYPSATELRDGTLGVVWADLSMADDSQAGEIRFARVKI
ncbi:MAG: sialidase family protein, partial [Bryobacteraceae bacterium]